MINTMYAAVALAAMLMFVSCPAWGDSHDNLLANADFSQGMPTDWLPQSYKENHGQEFLWLRALRALAIEIPEGKANDVFWKQEIQVKPNTEYILSGWIKTKDVTETIDTVNVGANLSVLESLPVTGAFTYSEPLLGNNGWRFRYVQFNTGDLDTITVALRLGMFSGQATGSAWFKGVTLQEVQ